MAVYKVIQDVEAEDKLVGFLSLKAFVYAGIAGLLAYISLRILIAGGPLFLRLGIVLILLLPIALFAILALPIGREQPTEVWFLSHVRFFLKPRKRLWNQAGLLQLVTITAPQKQVRQLTKNLSKNEVDSRLKALALTLDSRGWAVKNVNINLSPAQGYSQQIVQPDSDRLVNAATMPQDVPVIDIHASDDILDEQNNPTAQNFARLMQQANSNRRTDIVNRINAARDGTVQPQSVDFRFLDEQPAAAGSGNTRFVSHTVVAPKQEDELHTRPVPQPRPAPKVTAQARADKLELIKAAKDDKVSTLATLANRRSGQLEKTGLNEVEISLH